MQWLSWCRKKNADPRVNSDANWVRTAQRHATFDGRQTFCARAIGPHADDNHALPFCPICQRRAVILVRLRMFEARDVMSKRAAIRLLKKIGGVTQVPELPPEKIPQLLGAIRERAERKAS